MWAKQSIYKYIYIDKDIYAFDTVKDFFYPGSAVTTENNVSLETIMVSRGN